MENQNDKETKRVGRNIIIGIIGVILFAFLVYGSLIYVIKEDKKELREKTEKLSAEQNSNSACSLKRDSLLKENKQLSIYKSLTKAMVHRDEASALLKHKIGDIVYLKMDSARVVIKDVIIGGNNYSYYINYIVVYKDKTTEEINPELIY